MNTATKPMIQIRPQKGLLDLELGSLWKYRELLYFLVWRDIKVRYKQTVIGAMWAILQPLITMVIFTVIFGNFAKIPSDDIPYPVFTYTALLPWTYFQQALNRVSLSLVGDQILITKIYFPRLLIPISAAVAPLVDFGLSFIILLGLMTWYGIFFTWWILMLPLFIFIAFLTALAFGLWLSPLNVWYRDVAYTLPFLAQIWMYASPVVYPVSIVPEKWRLLFSLNPMTGVIESFRWALLGKESPDFTIMVVSVNVVFLFLMAGVVFFRRIEHTFADVM